MPSYPSPYILLRSGARFYYERQELNAGNIRLADIVSGLRQPRYTGQTEELYTIAQHAILVAEILESWGCDAYTAYMGLHHDDHEAVIGDLPSPMQWWLRGALQPYLKLEHEGFDLIAWAKNELDKQIMPAMGIAWPPQEGLWALVKEADYSAFLCESEQLFLEPPRWTNERRVRLVDKHISVMSPSEAVVAYLGKHHSVAQTCGIGL